MARQEGYSEGLTTRDAATGVPPESPPFRAGRFKVETYGQRGVLKGGRPGTEAVRVKPVDFEYHRARGLDDALAALAGSKDARAYAGGQSLVPLLNFRLSRPALLVDINRVTELDGMERTASGLRIGALVRHQTLADHPLIRETVPVLAEAARHIGHRAVRVRGTLGGSLAHADPAAELPAAMVALDAAVLLTGPAGRRRIPARQFFLAPYMTALGPGELVEAVEVPLAAPLLGFAEIARRPGDFAWAGAFLAIGSGKAAVTWFGLTPVPARREAPGPVPAAADREAYWRRLARDLPWQVEDAYHRHLALLVAERAYRDLNGGAGDRRD